MIESSGNDVADSGEYPGSQAEKQTTSSLLKLEDHPSPPFIPELMRDILTKVTDENVAEELKSAISNIMREFTRYQEDYKQARYEAEHIREKLHRTEVELSDLRSAVALTVAGQDDALVNLQRRYDEELASWRSISEQQIAEIKATSQMILEEERANWAGERNALLARFSCAQRKLSLQEKTTDVSLPGVDVGGTVINESAAAPNGGGSVKLFSVPDRISGQNLANQALEGMERMARRVKQKVLANNVLTENDLMESILTREGNQLDHQALQRKLRMHENEVLKLRHLLAETAGEAFQSVGISSGYNTSAQAPSATIASSSVSQTRAMPDACCTNTSNPVNLKPDRSEVDEVKSLIAEDTSEPITETSWVQLQSRLKELPKQSSVPCAMCLNYEQQLQKLQLSHQEQDKNFASLRNELSTKMRELNEEVQTRSQLESDLKTRCSAQNDRILQLESEFTEIHRQVEHLLTEYQSHVQVTDNKLIKLARERQSIQTEMNSLQMHYDALLGRRSTAAAELSERPIQLPSDKTELELFALKLFEENLSLREAREHLDERLKSDNHFHQQQLLAERQERTNLENTLQRDLDEAQVRLASLSDLIRERDTEAAYRVRAEQEAKSAQAKLIELQKKLSETEEEASSARAEVIALQNRIVTLQSDLDNVESVQADFVRLSQNLQVQLERLRQQDQEVRWVDPEDVSVCFACQSPFPTGSGSGGRKNNCRHCGKVHCSQCLKNAMPSGPIGRLAPVCDVCYTLLNKHVAPYFSTSFQDPSTGTLIRVTSPTMHHHNSDMNSSPLHRNSRKLHSQSPN